MSTCGNILHLKVPPIRKIKLYETRFSEILVFMLLVHNCFKVFHLNPFILPEINYLSSLPHNEIR